MNVKQYQFGPWTFYAETGTLQQNGATESLDPKIADLLHLFLQHPGKLFSRDELLDIIWSGTVVNDNSVSWAISQLRKALGDEAKAPLYLQTLPKKGYRFIADVTPLTKPSSEKAHKASTRQQFKLLKSTTGIVSIVASLLVVAIVIYLLPQQNPSNSSIQNPFLFTAMDGVEKSASLSPDGLLMAFVHKAPDDNSFTIWLKPLKENRQFNETKMDGTVLPDKIDSTRDVAAWPLLNDNASYERVHWGLDAYNLFAVRLETISNSRQHCHIVQIKLDLSRKAVIQERELSNCFAGSLPSISFNAKTNILYFTDKREGDNSKAIYEYDVATAQTTPLLKADTTGRGIHFIDFNPTNETLLYLQDIDWRHTRFATLSTADNVVNTLFTQEARYYSAYWGIAPDSIWLNWGNDKVLEYQIASGKSALILTSSFGWNINLKPAGAHRATFEVSDANGADFVFFDRQRWHKTPTNYTESSASWSPITGKLAFISNQNGLPQVWLKRSRHEMPTQLSNATEFSEIQYLSWSQDENNIIGVSDNVVGLLNLQQSHYLALLNNGIAPYWPLLSPDNQHVLVSHQLENQWQLYLYPVQDNPITQAEISPFLLTDGYMAEFIDQNTIMFSRKDNNGLFSLNLETKEETTLWSELPAGSFWQLHKQTIYYHEDRLLKSIELPIPYSNSLTPTSNIVTKLPEGLSHSFDVNPVTGEVLFLDHRRTQSDIRIGHYQPSY